MLSSAQPSRLPKPFAASAAGGYIRTIPTASQIGIVNGAASLTDGFPPLNMTPLASGGVPPFGQDFNGILNWVTSISQWYQAGAPTIFDPTFAAAIGGYPKGAVLQSATLDGRFWRSTAESNTADPDGGGAGWASFFAPVFANPTFTGTLTASGPAAFNSTVGLGSSAVAGTQAVNDNSTKVSTTAYADRAATNAYNAAVAWASGNDATTLATAEAYADAKDVTTLAAARQGRAQSTATVVVATPGGVNGLTAVVTAPCNGVVLVVASMNPETTMVGGGSSFRILKNGVDVQGFHSTGAITATYAFAMTTGQVVNVDGQNTMDGGTSALTIGIALSVVFVPAP